MLSFALSFLVLFPFFYLALVSKNFDLVFKLKRVWTRAICFGSFLHPVITYQTKKYPLPKPSVIVANHTSYLDIIFCTLYVDHTAVFMAKHELLKIPLFRYFFVYFDIAVNRKSITDSHKAFIEAGKKIEGGMSLYIFPEGTISTYGTLKPFKNGPFRLAIDNQVPVVPVVNLNNWKYLQNGGFFKSYGRPGFPKIVVGDPIPTIGLTEKDVPELKQKVHTFMQQELEKFYGK